MKSSGRSSSSSSPPSSPTRRRGNGVLLNEPSPGLDTVYDGAHDMKSTAFLFGAKGTRWTTQQAYGASFRSNTPRPWQRPPTRAETMTPILGPGDYDPFGDTHSLSASISWSSRGRSGPIGHPFNASRRSPPFRSTVDRMNFTARQKHGPTSHEDCFVLASDARREQRVRADFVDQLQRRVANNVFQPPQRLLSAPGI
jgi:hypothetical protein